MEIILVIVTVLSAATLLSRRLNPMKPVNVSSRPR
jgi:hypothetical protein